MKIEQTPSTSGCAGSLRLEAAELQERWEGFVFSDTAFDEPSAPIVCIVCIVCKEGTYRGR